MYAITLQGGGFETETVSNGQAALKRLQQITPALVLVDLHLPLVSGEAILERLERDDRFSGVRVLLISADVKNAERLRERVDLVLVKPISVRELRAQVERLFSVDRGCLCAS